MPQAVIIAAIQAAVTIAIELSKAREATDAAAGNGASEKHEKDETARVKKFYEEINTPGYQEQMEKGLAEIGVEYKFQGRIDSSEELRAVAQLMEEAAEQLYLRGRTEQADELTRMAQTYEMMANKAEQFEVESGPNDVRVVIDNMFTPDDNLIVGPGGVFIEDPGIDTTIQDPPLDNPVPGSTLPETASA